MCVCVCSGSQLASVEGHIGVCVCSSSQLASVEGHIGVG